MITILANGNYPTHPIPQQILSSTERVICCDGAANRFVAEGGTPFAIVGDADSLSAEVRKNFAHCLHSESEQDSNDLTKAMRFAKSLGETDITILGATGLRECHTLGNISLLLAYRQQGFNPTMLTDHCTILALSGTQMLQTQPGQQISIFSFGAKNLKSHGLKWPIYDFTALWEGTLNEALGHTITIEADGDYIVMLDYIN
jgi:thiamine pyrophosphokinase